MGLSDFPHGPAYSSRSTGSESHAPTAGRSRVASVFLGVHAVVFTPAEVLTPQRSPVTGLGSGGLAAFPVFPAGRLPRSTFRGLHDVYGYGGLHPWQVPVGLSAPEASAVSLPPLTAPIPSGWNVLACRAGVTPAETQRLCTAHGNLFFENVGWRRWGRGVCVLTLDLRVLPRMNDPFRVGRRVEIASESQNAGWTRKVACGMIGGVDRY